MPQIVYAAVDNMIVWSDNNAVHKAGRVPLYEPMVVVGAAGSDWYAIERPDNITLPANPSYPDYWVKTSDVLLELPGGVPEVPEVPEVPGDTITDEMAAISLVTFLKWIKQ